MPSHQVLHNLHRGDREVSCGTNDMAHDGFVHILKSCRSQSPRTMRSALVVLENALEDVFGTDACALLIPAERAVYTAGLVSGASRRVLAEAMRISHMHRYRWADLNPSVGGTGREGGTAPISILQSCHL